MEIVINKALKKFDEIMMNCVTNFDRINQLSFCGYPLCQYMSVLIKLIQPICSHNIY